MRGRQAVAAKAGQFRLLASSFVHVFVKGQYLLSYNYLLRVTRRHGILYNLFAFKMASSRDLPIKA
jgi:hypothetical protein